MGMLITLFWWGFIICISIWIFQFVLGLFFMLIGLVIAGFESIIEKWGKKR